MPGKNTKGGKKHKRNKNYTSDTKALRYKEEDQEYAKVTKCKGNCRFEVLCCDGKTRAAVLCGGMRKRKFINQGQLVLVSIREWQDDICDIIDSYEESHAKRLKSEKEIPESFSLGEENTYDSEDEIEFETGLPDDGSDSDEEVAPEDEVDLDDI
jgi:translation initiation factor 1A|tara:strand:+ start:683 stop:1147 length:465 start_codon:yes stop_codon:yes gene_type:complete